MADRDDPYDRGEPEEDTSRPGRRHATRPARPAWDALTYGRPDDMRPPMRGRPSEEPSYSSPSYEPEPDWTSLYGSPPPTAPSYAPPAPTAPSYAPPPASTAPSYPASTPPSYPPPYPPPPNPASSYPAATDSYAPESYTSYRAAPAPEPVGDESEPVYVPAGLYLDEPASADPAIAGSGPGDRGAARPQGDVSAYPGGKDDEPAPRKGGRNVPAAIGVGLGLGAVVLGTLFLWRPAFLGVVAAAVCVGSWEMVRALRLTGANPPLVPLIGGGALMTGLAWWGGTEGLTFGLVITVVAVMVWRFAHGAEGYAADVTMAALVAVYVPFLGGFAAMLASAPDGQLRVLAMLIAVVLSDTGGYVVGSRLGRHPMAPAISPKKSWEGLAGSLLAAALGSGLVLWLMFSVTFWAGLLFGLAIAVASVVGDLGESMVKRALGVKDMSGLLPGHGGVMDRLDSVLFAAPVGFVLLSILVPVM